VFIHMTPVYAPNLLVYLFGDIAALAEALWWCANRTAFGRRLIEQPMMRAVLADLALEWEGARALALRFTERVDGPEHVREPSCALFESAQSEKLLQGRSIEGFAAAAVYATCRTASVSRTIPEIVADARASADELRAAYDALNRDMGLPTGPIDPREYLARFASELDLPTDLENRARELADRAHDRNLVAGRNPAGVAAACLYTAATERDHPLTQAAVADVADVTPVTVRSTYEDLC
jgi:transcription initiation factor TFIIB